MVNMGLAYRDRLKGTRMANLDRAIMYLNRSLRVYQTADPRDQRASRYALEWATVQHHLAALHGARRLDGSTELAIDYLKAALSIFSPSKTPEQWANAQAYIGEQGGVYQTPWGELIGV